LAIDISIDACALAARFFSSIGVHVDVLNANGFSGCKLAILLIRLDRAGIDVMMFNPPYVPTETSELTNAADLVTAKQSKFTELFSTGLRGDEVPTTLYFELLNAIESINLIDSSYAGGIDGM
jgi:methylase of polypeptide subunit release factors